MKIEKKIFNKTSCPCGAIYDIKQSENKYELLEEIYSDFFNESECPNDAYALMDLECAYCLLSIAVESPNETDFMRLTQKKGEIAEMFLQKVLELLNSMQSDNS